MSSPSKPSGICPASTTTFLQSALKSSPQCVSTGSTSFAPPMREQFLGQFDLVRLDQALADLAPLGKRKRVRHRPADQDFVADRQQIADDVDLVGDFRPAQDGDERPLGIGERVGEVLHLFGDQEAHDLRFLAHRQRHGDHRRVLAVTRAEGVVAIDVGQVGKRLGEGGVALLLAGVKPQVLEHEHAARPRAPRLWLSRLLRPCRSQRPPAGPAARPAGRRPV